MDNERRVLAASLQSREAFNRLDKLKPSKYLSELGRHIWVAVEGYYSKDSNVTRVTDPEILGLSKGAAGKRVGELLTELHSTEVSPENIASYFADLRRDDVGAKIASRLAAGTHDEETAKLISEYGMISAKEEEEEGAEVLCGLNVADIASTQRAEGLIKIYPKSLNDRLDGGVLPGHHLLVFARPEMGKTLMLVNMVYGFLSQGLRVLYVGNEDPINDIAMRTISRLTGMTKYEIIDNPDKADEVARSRGYNNVVFASLAPGTPREIEALVQKYKPQVVLLDQLRNLNVGEEHFVQKLEKAATYARNLGKKHGLVMVSVTQAGDSASGKAILDMGDVDSSNTGIPAQVDVMIGMGATNDDMEKNWRVLTLCKNKRSGRHEYFTIGIDPVLSRIRSME